MLQSPEVRFRGQFVAVVVAESAGVARQAAELVRIAYDARDHDVVLRAGHPGLYAPEQVNPAYPTDTEDGDVEAAPRVRGGRAWTRPTPRRSSTTTRWSRTPRSRAGIRRPAPDAVRLHAGRASVRGS